MTTAQSPLLRADEGWGARAGKAGLLAGSVAAVAVLGSIATSRGVGTWYRRLRKPSFTPPAAAFGPVWTVLYGTMAYSAYRVLRTPPSASRTQALRLWALQLLLNGLWSPVFFGLRRPRAALLDQALLVPAIGSYARAAARLDRGAGLLMLPYLAWVSFATVLNAAIVRLNPRVRG